jgi:hypothetical protein
MKKMKQFLTKKKAAVAAGAGSLALIASNASAALSIEEQALVDTVTGKLTDLVSAITSMVTANLGVAAAIIVGSLIIGYFYRAGRG